LHREYDAADILYSVKQLTGNGLIEATEKRVIRGHEYIIKDITPRGHEFLHNVRSSGVWTETKKRAKHIGSFALEVLSKIAMEIIMNKIEESHIL
jgi:DNA-binding PadR family transcriptional regulator